MKKIFSMVLFFFLALVITPQAVRAGDASEAILLGLSADEKYAAILEQGVQDGSGFAYVAVTILDVQKNTYVATTDNPIIEDEGVSLKKLRETKLIEARKFLKKYDISRVNRGILLASRKLTDLSPSVSTLKFSLSPNVPGLSTREFTLSLKEKTAPKSTRCYFEETPKMFSLSITSERTGKTTSMQDDSSLPSTRGCALSYRIQDVYALEKSIETGKPKILVLLNIFTTGFEGNDSRIIAVSKEVTE